MPQLAIAPSFLDDFSRLDRSVQSAALSVVRDFVAGDRSSLEPLSGARDERVRVLQIGPEWSGVVVPTDDDIYCLVTIRRHDDALAYARSYPPVHDPSLALEELVLPAPDRPVSGGAPRVTAPPELASALEQSFPAWRITLHPKHQRLAQAEFAGPAQITGGPGTGKTVLALHRALHLATLDSAGFGLDDQTPVLVTTSSRLLAQTLSGRLDRLITDPAIRARIDVSTIDALARGLVAERTGIAPEILTSEALSARWREEARAEGLPYTGRFLADEWEQVILTQELADLSDYIRCERSGRLVHLAPELRPHVWRTLQRYSAELNAERQWSHPQLAREATSQLRRSGPRYRHVIALSTQELHPTQLRLLRSLVDEGPNDLLLLGDPRLRDYGHRVSLISLGINVRGRSHRLREAYRVTQEILRWASPIMDRAPSPVAEQAAEGPESYRSALRGPEPFVHAARNRADEYVALTQRVRSWLTGGVLASEIAVGGRNQWVVRRLRKELLATGVATAPLDAPDDVNAVRVGTMHGLRGQEFRCVALMGLSDPLLPPKAAVDDAEGDPVALEQVYAQERHLLWSACTRARDALYVSYVGAPSRLLPQLGHPTQ